MEKMEKKVKLIKENKDALLTILSKMRHGHELELINGLCDRAKMYVLDYLLSYVSPKFVHELALEYDAYNSKLRSIEQIFLDYLLSYGSPKFVRELALEYNAYNSKLRPIEQIFQVVYFQYISGIKIWQIENLKYIDDNIPILSILLNEFTSKKEILCKNKKYVADFILDFSREYISGPRKGEYIYPKLKNLKYIIELDSVKSTKNKYQINYDCEMENTLKELGYTLVKFTDKMVYDNPYSCVDKLITIIFKDIKSLKDTNI